MRREKKKKKSKYAVNLVSSDTGRKLNWVLTVSKWEFWKE